VLIALLAVLGVDLIVIVFVVAGVLTRRRWVRQQTGAFKGAIRVVKGDVHGLKMKWSRGYGRWVSNVLVWTKAPFLFRNELVVAEALASEMRTAKPGEVKRLGNHPMVVSVASERGGWIEVAFRPEESQLAVGPLEVATSVTD
jgi:hypothetical protein